MSTDLSAKESTESQPESGQFEKSRPARRWRKWPGPVLGVVAALLCILAAIGLNHRQAKDQDFIEISGRIEAPETYITAGVGTRVQSVNVQEGDRLRKGQVLLSLDDSALKVKMQATHAQEGLAKQAQGQASQQVQAAEQDVEKARAKSKGFFAKIFSSKKKKDEVKAQLTNEMKSAQMQLLQAQAMVIKSQAARGEVSSKAPYFTITSPLDGICVTRSVEPGETVAPGQVLLSIIDPERIYMRGFIPEGKLSQVKLGQSATISLDSSKEGENRSEHAPVLNARVTAIDSSPSFTPQNIYFEDARIRQVFGLKLAIDQSDGSAKPGMPAAAKIQPDRDK